MIWVDLIHGAERLEKESWGFPKLNSLNQQLFIEWLLYADTFLEAGDTAENKTDKIPASIPGFKQKSWV